MNAFSCIDIWWEVEIEDPWRGWPLNTIQSTVKMSAQPSNLKSHNTMNRQTDRRCDVIRRDLRLKRYTLNSNITSFFRFADKRAIYRWYDLICTCAGECDWLIHWQHKLCVTFSANVNINYRLPIKVYYRMCTLRRIRIEINHGSQNVFWVLTWIGGY